MRSFYLLLLLLVLPKQDGFAQTQVDSLRNQLAVETDDSTRVVQMMELSRALHRLQLHDDEDLLLATQATDLAVKQDTILFARALNNLGLLYRYYQRYEESIPLHIKAYELIAHVKDHSIDKMTFANNAGVSARYNAEYDLAMNYYMKALKIAEDENNERNIEIACNGIGNTYMAIPGKEKEGLAYLERALDVAKRANNQRGIAMQFLTIGGYYDQLGQHDKARRYLAELLSLNKSIEDLKGKGMTLKALGESYLIEGRRLGQAETHFHEAFAVFKEINDRQQQAHTLLKLGELHHIKHHYDQGLSVLKQAMIIARELNDKALLQSISAMTSRLYEGMQNYPLALKFYKQSRDYQDSINLENQMVQISAISRRYDLEKKESEIELLLKEQSLQEMLLDKRSFQLKNRGAIIGLLTALFLTLSVIFLLNNRNRKNKRKAEQLLVASETERLKAVYEKNLVEAEILASQMRINPHFLFNCLNSIKNLIQHDHNKRAIKYLVMLSRFSRLVLETANSPAHSLEEELDLMKYYIELEKNRFDDHFSYDLENQLGEELDEIYLPSLLLQPFIENAIWHGLLPSEKEIKLLSIKVEQDGELTKVSIEDTGVGRFHVKADRQHKSRGTEINDKRIELFNKNHSSTIHYHFIDKQDSLGNALGTSVVIHIKKTKCHEDSHS